MERGMTLAEVSGGSTLTIERILGEPSFRRRLYGLGFLPGAEIRVARRMPFGGPLEVEVRGVRMGLRVQDARWIEGRIGG